MGGLHQANGNSSRLLANIFVDNLCVIVNFLCVVCLKFTDLFWVLWEEIKTLKKIGVVSHNLQLTQKVADGPGRRLDPSSIWRFVLNCSSHGAVTLIFVRCEEADVVTASFSVLDHVRQTHLCILTCHSRRCFFLIVFRGKNIFIHFQVGRCNGLTLWQVWWQYSKDWMKNVSWMSLNVSCRDVWWFKTNCDSGI